MSQNEDQGSEDPRQAQEHVRNVQENRDALEDQARRVEASAPDSTGRPVEGLRVDGMGGEDNAQAAENQRSVRENTEALRAEARRVEETAPDDVNRTGPRNG